MHDDQEATSITNQRGTRTRSTDLCVLTVFANLEKAYSKYQEKTASSPCLFAIVKDRMTNETRQEAPWTTMFAGDMVICTESKEQL